jgi:hypothetical protein
MWQTHRAGEKRVYTVAARQKATAIDRGSDELHKAHILVPVLGVSKDADATREPGRRRFTTGSAHMCVSSIVSAGAPHRCPRQSEKRQQ